MGTSSQDNEGNTFNENGDDCHIGFIAYDVSDVLRGVCDH